MDTPARPETSQPVRRWFGPSALVAALVFVVGRLALEPVRELAHFDDRGMEAFGAVEAYVLRKNPDPVKVAFFGSSQSLWAVLADDVASDLGEDPRYVRNLAVEGGTPFDIWNMIRRNEDKFKNLRLAIIEVNPFVLKVGLDADPRVTVDIARHASIEERLLLAHRKDRIKQVSEWMLPLLSIRRSLRSATLNVLDPDPGMPVYPCPEQRISPAVGWKVDGYYHVKKDRTTLDPMIAAKRMVGAWRLSKLQDHSLRQSLEWFAQHKIPVMFHELPVHPEVMRAMHSSPLLEQGHETFLAYVDSLKPAPIARFYSPDPETCGITAEQMADRTHVNELGAHIYSHHIGGKIREVMPELIVRH